MKLSIRLFLTSLIVLCLNFEVLSQGYEDLALLYGQSFMGGTARIRAMGGAQMALGGDISVISGNPAGLGFYNRSDVAISGNFSLGINSTSFRGTSENAVVAPFSLPNIGGVLNFEIESQQSGWRTHSLGFSVNRINSFRNSISYGGEATDANYVDYAIGEANFQLAQQPGAVDPEFLTGLPFLAFQTYLIDPVYDENGVLTEFSSSTLVPDEENPTTQDEVINNFGRMGQVNISWGANYMDRIYIGLGATLTSINHDIEREYSEFYRGDIIDRMDLIDERQINGSGFSGRFGIIARPINILTIGASYQTPTYVNLTDRGSLFQLTEFNSSRPDEFPTTADWQIDFDDFEFSLVLPARAQAGAALFLGKKGFVTSDVEYVSYRRTELIGGDFTAQNEFMDTIYNDVLNVRLGGEFRLGKFRLRGGGGILSNPVRDSELDAERYYATGGIGFRSSTWYFDLAYQYITQQSAINPYPGAPFASTNGVLNSVTATVGFLF